MKRGRAPAKREGGERYSPPSAASRVFDAFTHTAEAYMGIV